MSFLIIKIKEFIDIFIEKYFSYDKINTDKTNEKEIKMGERKVKISLIQAIAVILVALLIAAGAITLIIKNSYEKDAKKEEQKIEGKIDDWEYDPKESQGDYGGGYSKGGVTTINSAVDTSGVTSESSANSYIGYSTGGAKDVNNFRENIKNGYFPISTDITYNGLFYDYTFDTGNKDEKNTENSEELFSPSYSCAVSKDPISNENEYYMTVGLNSNIKESDFQRKKLNLVVVLDISGSMSSSFNSYYYDQFVGNEKNSEEKSEEESKSKMQIANESVNILIDQLKDDDRFGMVLFDDSAYLGKPIRLVKDTDMEAIKGHVLEIDAMGGTNFEAGYKKATELFDEYKNSDANEYENRIIFITDAMPNYGVTSEEGLLSLVGKNANDGIYTTFIGVGVDFNTKLIEEITDVKGANYYSVHNSKEFKERMGEQFEYMVTPLVFDLNLDFASDSYKLEAVYGTDSKDKDSGNIMKVNTLFPSKTTSDGEVKGGVVLLKLRKLNDNGDGKIKLKVSYKDRNGQSFENSQEVTFDKTEEFYDNTGIRKAIVLVRYANTLKNWILYERSENDKFIITSRTGIVDCDIVVDEIVRLLGEQERVSTSLSVSKNYQAIFEKLQKYMQHEINEIKDETMNQEIELLNILIKR